MIVAHDNNSVAEISILSIPNIEVHLRTKCSANLIKIFGVMDDYLHIKANILSCIAQGNDLKICLCRLTIYFVV